MFYVYAKTKDSLKLAHTAISRYACLEYIKGEIRHMRKAGNLFISQLSIEEATKKYLKEKLK